MSDDIKITKDELKTLRDECMMVMEETPDLLKAFCGAAGIPEPSQDEIKKLSTLTAGILSGRYEYAGFGTSNTNSLSLLLNGAKLSVQTMREITKQCSVVNTCVDSWSRNISNTSWKIEAREGYSERPTIKRRVEDFFKKPLYYENGYNFRQFMSRNVRDLAIVDWSLMEKLYSKGGKLLGLTPLDVGVYTIEFDEDLGYPKYYYYDNILKNGKVVKSKIPAQNCVSIFMNPCTESGFGNPPIEGILEEIGTLVFSTIAIRKDFTHGEIPEGLLNLGMISRATADSIESDMMTKAGQSWKLRILWGLATAEWIELKRPNTEMQRSQLMQAFEKTVYRKYGFTPIEMAEPDSSKGSSREQKNLGRSRLFNPIMNAYKEQFDYIIAKDFGAPELEFNWYPFEIEDQESLGRAYQRFQDCGGMSPNDVARKIGKDPVLGGDERFLRIGNDIILIKDLPSYKPQSMRQGASGNGQEPKEEQTEERASERQGQGNE
jgi:hypothetical protein